MRLFIFFLMCALGWSCAEQTSQKPSLMDNFPEFDLQGHRGARGLLPENTIPSLIEAVQHGVTTLEIDIVASADSLIVISHEPWFHHDISSHPNGNPVTIEEARSLNIFEMTYSEIRQYDVGKRGHQNYPEQQPIPAYKPLMLDAIQAVEDYIRQNNLPPVNYNIEIKSHPNDYDVYYPQPEEYIRLIVAELANAGISDRFYLQSFDVNPLIVLRQNHSEIPIALLVNNDNGLDWNLNKLGYTPEIYSPNFRFVNAELVERVHDLGMKLIPWTVNESDDMQRLTEMGVDGLITDYPNRAMELESVRSKMGR